MRVNNRVTWFLVVITITILWGIYPSIIHSKQNSLWAQDVSRGGIFGPAASQGSTPASPAQRGGGPGADQGGRGGRGGAGDAAAGGSAINVQRPNKAARLASITEIEKQIAALRTAIKKAPEKDPGIQQLQAEALTAFIIQYNEESNALNQIVTTINTLRPAAGGRGGRGGGEGSLTTDVIVELTNLAQSEKATRVVSRLEAVAKETASMGGGGMPGGDQGGRGGDRGGMGGGRGGFQGRGPDGGMPTRGSPMLGGGRGSFTLSDAEIEQIMQQVQRRDPNLAKELRDIRSTNPRLFDSELRRTPEYGNQVDSRLSQARGRIPTEFLDWLSKYLPNDANDLRDLRQKDADLYISKYNNTYQKYRIIFEQTRMDSDPNLANILIYDLSLEGSQNELQRQIQDPRNAPNRNELITQLTKVVIDRYDVITQKKQLQYEQLLKIVNDYQKQINAKMNEINQWKDPNFKKSKSRIR